MSKSYSLLDKLQANRAALKTLDIQIEKLTKLATQLENDVSIPVSNFEINADIRAIGGHSDLTASKAMNMPSDVKQLLGDIRRMIIKRARAVSEIDIAENALAFLNERERLIVTFRSVQHMSWDDVAFEYWSKTNHQITVRTCRLAYTNALKKLSPFFETHYEQTGS